MAATVVDHIRPLHLGGAARDPANLQSLCSDCHDLKTAREHPGRRLLGADLNGNLVARPGRRW